ncbi:DUF1376 domain-containing protein [Bordetella bronchiseptica]|uniref:DUF1376 domain-containing protein n=1 Tax=Bordetella bronchiseptica TaxID=518 RepID=UPI00046134FE|nr:DUF1376 domain-containing protein [Bordetella bronchiseptica]KDC15408.1 PF07120 family protein [Bordetella bronchiseptica F-1]KDC29249.1 PF07120 family protein [Bordetella bronchiseptica F2]
MTKPAPYPADTRAKGWRFELDHERIRQSDTWALAAPEIRPWLLMLWMTAWEQTPCGSLPQDDELIAARIGMPLDQFRAVRSRLLRGWWLADDGRLYHDTLAERVLEMIERRDGERNRKAEYRERKKAERAAQQAEMRPDKSSGSPVLSHGTDGGLPRDSGVSDATGTGTGTSNKKDIAAASHGGAPACEADPAPPPLDGDKTLDEKALAVAVWLRRKEEARGKQPRGTQSNDPRISAWIKAGVTGLGLLEAYLLAVADREATGDAGPITPGFLDVFVAKMLKPPTATSAVNGKRPAPAASDPLAWATTASGIEGKGIKLGVQQRAGELFPHFKARVVTAAGLSDEDKARLLADYGVRV